jgi:para-aminobenzoate synthetase component 1
MIHFGTGAGITFSSDSSNEWNETELKADRLIKIASGAQS